MFVSLKLAEESATRTRDASMCHVLNIIPLIESIEKQMND